MHFVSDMGHVFNDLGQDVWDAVTHLNLVRGILDAIFTFLANFFGTIQDYVD